MFRALFSGAFASSCFRRPCSVRLVGLMGAPHVTSQVLCFCTGMKSRDSSTSPKSLNVTSKVRSFYSYCLRDEERADLQEPRGLHLRPAALLSDQNHFGQIQPHLHRTKCHRTERAARAERLQLGIKTATAASQRTGSYSRGSDRIIGTEIWAE